MKITNVNVHILKCDNFPFHYGDAASFKSGRILNVLELNTDEGLVGWGDWGGVIQPGQNPTRPVYDSYFQWLVGEDCFDANRIYQKSLSVERVNQGMLSALDIALWDLRGKKAGLPLSSLLGGQLQSEIPVYASLQNYRHNIDLEKWMVSQVKEALDKGFKRIKMKIGGCQITEDIGYVSIVRKMLNDVQKDIEIPLAVDANQTYSFSEAVQMGNLLDSLGGIVWFEEPLIREDIDGYHSLHEKVNVAISGGEGCKSVTELHAYLRARALDISQPDVQQIGGITNLYKAYSLAEVYGIPTYVHCFFGCLERIAALHLMSVQKTWGSPFRGLSEATLEWETAYFPARDELLNENFAVNGRGNVTVPTQPGLGVTLNSNTLQKYAWK